MEGIVLLGFAGLDESYLIGLGFHPSLIQLLAVLWLWHNFQAQLERCSVGSIMGDIF